MCDGFKDRGGGSIGRLKSAGSGRRGAKVKWHAALCEEYGTILSRVQNCFREIKFGWKLPLEYTRERGDQ